jgi:hypothetical protein
MQNIKRIFATAIFILVSFLSVAEAEEAKEVSSTALMTVSVSRSFIEKKINSILPRVLQKIDENMICNQPLHIRCNVIGEVRRNGRVRVRFSKGALRLAIPAVSKVNISGPGPLGIIISKDVELFLTIYSVAKVSISKNWRPQLSLKSSFSWSKTPELKILGVFTVNIARYSEPLVLKELEIKKRSVIRELRKLDLKGRAEQAWRDIQKPIVLSEDPRLRLVYKPESIGMSPFKADDKILHFRVFVAGRARVMSSAVPFDEARDIVPLPRLLGVPRADDAFSVYLPIFIRFDDLQDRINQKLPKSITIKSENSKIKGELTIRDISFSQYRGGKLRVLVDFAFKNKGTVLKKLDLFGEFDPEGKAEFDGIPTIDAASRTLRVTDIDLKAHTSSGLLDLAFEIARLEPIKKRIEEHLVFDISEEIAMILRQANVALNKPVSESVALQGQLKRVEFDGLEVGADEFRLRLQAFGFLNLNAGFH